MSQVSSGAYVILGGLIAAGAALGSQYLMHRFARRRDRESHLRAAYADLAAAGFRLIFEIRAVENYDRSLTNIANAAVQTSSDGERQASKEAYELREARQREHQQAANEVRSQLHAARCRLMLLHRNREHARAAWSFGGQLLELRCSRPVDTGKPFSATLNQLETELTEWVEQCADVVVESRAWSQRLARRTVSPHA
jgi:hypothetical protein